MLEVRLAQIVELTPSVRQFVLESELPLPSVEPGAHIDVFLPGGIIRQYSLIAPLCTERRYVIAVKRETAGRGGSAWLHAQARPGVELRVSAPRNHFALEEGVAPVLLIAGGIGITPIYAMFRALQSRGRQVALHYWCSSQQESLFAPDLCDLSDATLHYPGIDRRDARAVVAAAPSGAHIYACGPQRLLQACEDAVRPDCLLRVERFSSLAAASPSEGFSVKLARSGREITVAAEETILSALLAAGVDAVYSCEEGVCGACETVVLDGEPEHLDSVRSPVAHALQRTMMICCSRARTSSLTLDL